MSKPIEVFNRQEDFGPADLEYFEPFEENILDNELWGDQVLEYTIDHLVGKYGEQRAKEIICEVLGLDVIETVYEDKALELARLENVQAQLHGKVAFGFDLDEDLKQFLVDEQIVIVFGYSDDLMEFDGAIYDEAGCYDGGTVWLNELDEKLPHRAIEAIWGGDDYDFKYETDIPHLTFDVLGDDPEYYEDRMYCRGIIFYMKDL